MREILFRGKKVLDGQWHYGSLQTFKGFSIFDASLKQWHTVRGETVGQYTGLTDKNGKRIFEGDIVKRCFSLIRGHSKKTREIQVGIVEYSNTECGFCLKNTCNLRKPWDGDTIEVIGNIHDNPELLR